MQEAEIMAVMAEDTTLTPQGAVDVWTQRKKGAQPTPITSSSQGAENLAKLQKETQEKNGLQYDANKQVAEAVTGDPEQSLDKLQSALDTAGLVEVLGTPADVANAVISLFRGNGKDAALSGASALPFGFFFAGVKIAGKRGDKAADAVGSLGDDAIGTGTSAARRASSFLTDTEFESLAQASFGGATKRVPLTKPIAKGTPDVEIDLISDSGDTFTQIKRVTSDKAVFAGKNQEQFMQTVDAAQRANVSRIRYVVASEAPATYVQAIRDMPLPEGMQLIIERLTATR